MLNSKNSKNKLKNWPASSMGNVGWVLAISVLLLAGCIPSSVRYSRLVPAQVPLPGVKTVAVLPFQARDPLVGNMAADKIATNLTTAGHFTVVERTQLDQALGEHRLTQTGLFDEATGAEVGRMVKADAVIMGSIPVCEANEGSEWVQTKKGGYNKYWRKVDLSATYKVVMLETGKQATGRSIRENAGDEDTDRAGLRSSGVLKELCVESMAHEVIRQISPHIEAIDVFFDPGRKQIGEALKTGLQFAKSGLRDEMVDSFRNLLSQFPESATVHYDMGVALYLTGQLDEAEGEVKHAVQLYPASQQAGTVGVELDTYAKMLTMIRAERQNLEKLKLQAGAVAK